MKLDFEKYQIYSIVADGAISIPKIGEGRLFPYLIIDAPIESKISQLISLHRKTPPGDTILHWTYNPFMFFVPKEIILKVEFKQPMETTFGIAFNLAKQCSALDGIIQSRGFFLQIGVIGDKVSSTFGSENILIEVPFMDFERRWNTILFNIVKLKFKKKGVTKSESNAFAKLQIKSAREFWNTRREN